MSSENILKFRTPKSALERAVELQELVGFEQLLIIGLPKDSDSLFVGASDDLSDPEAVYLLENCKLMFCLPIAVSMLNEIDEDEEE